MKLTIRKTRHDPIEVELEPSDLVLEVACSCNLGKLKGGRKCFQCDGTGWFTTDMGYKILEFVQRHAPTNKPK